ncbi:hypothetical protein H70357_08280 [Paenibacillus sp. FSL H7-0357]|uniref:ABC transporter permease n=1 Tax=Paenibacillus sp. FSL H7-0357 TaxID=1536774 RepID=UPI0004F74F37|nr:ABC transporter permease [Paenibacillus sp. FSL H7-0357]AIQ16659.1 hypothetical protein H70357_08280 [Paenibacillus sp. FSL H7-0357]
MILLKKMFRDIWSEKAQFLTIIIIVACGVFAYAGITTVGSRLQESVSDFYSKTHLNDLWINGAEISEEDVAAISQLDGVEEAQGRTVHKVHSGNSQLDLFILGDNKLSRPYLMEGQAFSPDQNGIWLDREYALANRLKVGDKIELDGVGSQSESAELVINGLVLSPEKVTDTSAETPSIRHDMYGYGFIGRASAAAAFGEEPMNQIILTVLPEAELEEVNALVEQVLGDKYISVVNQAGYNSTISVEEQIIQFNTIAYIAPLFFFLLAILVVVSTMTRLIAKQRIQIGTLMSLGFSSRQIQNHYLSYGLWMGLVGGGAGLILGCFGLPAIFMRTLTQSFILPEWSQKIPLHTVYAVIVICLCCTLGVLLAAGSKLKELPAFVLKGQPKKRPAKTVMENFKNSWERISFENKWIIRNMNASRIRGIMGIIGSFACTFLILFGLSNINTSNRSVGLSYENQYLYTYKAELNRVVAPNTEMISGNDYQYIQEGELELRSGEVRRNQPVKIADTGDYINLDMDNREPMKLPASGIVLSERTAKVLGINIGGTVEWRFGGGKWSSAIVADTVVIPTANEIFISRTAWESMGETFQPTSILAGAGADLQQLRNSPAITQVLAKADMKAATFKLNEGVFGTAIVLTLSAILLGTTVIYSLGLISLTEMGREFATLKVLGFRHKEIKRLLFSENMLITVTGIILALPLGTYVIKATVRMSNSERMELFPEIKPYSYMIAIVVTLLCSYLVSMVINSKIEKIDMVTSLKSVE